MFNFMKMLRKSKVEKEEILDHVEKLVQKYGEDHVDFVIDLQKMAAYAMYNKSKKPCRLSNNFDLSKYEMLEINELINMAEDKGFSICIEENEENIVKLQDEIDKDIRNRFKKDKVKFTGYKIVQYVSENDCNNGNGQELCTHLKLSGAISLAKKMIAENKAALVNISISCRGKKISLYDVEKDTDEKSWAWLGNK